MFFENLDFGECGPQKTTSPKLTFCHISKSIRRRKPCNTSLERYFGYLCHHKKFSQKISFLDDFWGIFEFLGFGSPKTCFTNFNFQKFRYWKIASKEVLYGFLRLILFEILPKIDFGEVVFWGPHSPKSKIFKKFLL